MKRKLFLLFIILLAAACSRSGNKTDNGGPQPGVEIATENLIQVSFDVNGMTCEGCEKAIVTSISKLDGIQEATASYIEQKAVISFDSSKTDTESISQAIIDAGYEVLDHSL